jgi:hypothetical protein
MSNHRYFNIFIAADFLTLFAAFSITFIVLYLVAGQTIDLVNLAKGEQNTSRGEVIEGKTYTASAVRDIKAIIDNRHDAEIHNPGTNTFYRIIWLGNSQLHYINQYREGDHLSPYWLRFDWQSSKRIEPLGMSLPNASLQEFLVLSRYAIMKVPVNLLLVELVFDDLREDGLRSDFSEMLTPDFVAEFRRSSTTAESMMGRFFSTSKGNEQEANDALSGTIQKPVEQWLNTRVSAVWKLWENRPQIEGNVLLALYNFRNYVLGIKPTTVRRMIQSRYDLNMDALRDMLNDYRHRGIPVLLYIAPIRQDKPIPYDPTEYSRWKNEMIVISKQYGAHLVNLEQLVPGELWGSYAADDIDFMHFQGPGHRLVADALLPHVKTILEDTER